MKKIQLISVITACLCFASVVSGCSYALGPVPSTTPLTNSSEYTVIGNVSGTSTNFSILFIPIGTNTPLRNAMQNAIDQKKADALIEVQADYYVYNFLFMFGIYTTEVRGKAIKINSSAERDLAK